MLYNIYIQSKKYNRYEPSKMLHFSSTNNDIIYWEIITIKISKYRTKNYFTQCNAKFSAEIRKTKKTFQQQYLFSKLTNNNKIII